MSFLLRSWVSPLLFGFVVADSGEASRRGSSLLGDLENENKDSWRTKEIEKLPSWRKMLEK